MGLASAFKISLICSLDFTNKSTAAVWPNGEGIGFRSRGLQVRVLSRSTFFINHKSNPKWGSSILSRNRFLFPGTFVHDKVVLNHKFNPGLLIGVIFIFFERGDPAHGGQLGQFTKILVEH